MSERNPKQRQKLQHALYAATVEWLAEMVRDHGLPVGFNQCVSSVSETENRVGGVYRPMWVPAVWMRVSDSESGR